MQAFSSDHFVLPLPAGHRFPMPKYRLLRERIEGEPGIRLREAPPASRGALEAAAKFAVLHRDIVRRFGRFPHRNAIVGRASTAEEIAWLAADAPDFGQKRR